jgi:hypothetical protein
MLMFVWLNPLIEKKYAYIREQFAPTPIPNDS